MSACCGLVIVSSKAPVPLKGISVDVQVTGFVADVSATLKYKNIEEHAVEAVFVFPMDEDSAVYSFEATVEGKKIFADIQEKKEAHKTYDDAISQGREAFLLEEDESSGDIFSCMVGNLPPGQEAEVTLKFVRELPLEADGAVRFVLPAVLNPRYTPKDQDQSVTASLPRVPIGEIPYTLSMSAHVQSVYGISKVQSNCEITPLEYINEDKTAAKVSLSEGHKFERDVELLIYYEKVNKPSVTTEAGLPDAEEGSLMAEPVVMMNFYPSFPEVLEQSKCGEFIFLVDRSGSMTCGMNSEQDSQQRIESAKETLILLLKSLPLGCYFNIYGFGSTFESFFPESMAYTQQSMEEAVKKVNEMNADLGGTEILEPLQKIYKTAGRPEHPRQLFVFTDGEVGNTKDVIAEVHRNATKHRCFAFGIGEGASTALIKGISRAASGTSEFITGKERMQPKVLKTLKCSLQPTVKDVSLKWTLPSGFESVQLSPTPTAIFQGQRSIIYAQLKGKVGEETEGQVCLEYRFKDDVFTNVLKFPLKCEKVERPTIHRLAAKALITELEDGTDADSEEIKKRIVEISVQSGVISSLTAYVAVNKDTKKPLEGNPVRRDIPAPVLMFGGPVMYSMPQPIAMACSFMPPPVAVCDALPEIYLVPEISLISEGVSEELADTSEAVNESEVEVLPSLKPETPPIFRLISLQNADGSWHMIPEFASILGVSEQELKEKTSALKIDSSVWATILAVIWLHTSGSEQRDEWELLVGKAVDWIKAKAGDSLSEYIRAGNGFLKTSVDPTVFGL
ncbi:von Willebrand factor A domain-containing protein 5A-like isoform 2-T2 [Discoglossus pictus]